MTTHASVPKMLVEMLGANSVVAQKIADRIHYQTIPEHSVYPHLYIARTDKDTDTLLDGTDGIVEDRYVLELIAKSFDDELVSAIIDALEFDGFDYEDLTIFTSDVSGVSDDYQFQSADSDALFMHGITLTIYLCKNE